MSSFRTKKRCDTDCGKCAAPAMFSVVSLAAPTAPGEVSATTRAAQTSFSDKVDSAFLANLQSVPAHALPGHDGVYQARMPRNDLGAALPHLENSNLTLRAMYMPAGADASPVCVQLTKETIEHAMQGNTMRVSLPLGNGHFDFAMKGSALHSMQFSENQ